MDQTLYYAGILSDARDLQTLYEAAKTETETFQDEIKLLSRVIDNAASSYIKLGNPYKINEENIEISIAGNLFKVSLNNVKSSLRKEFERINEKNNEYLKLHDSVDVNPPGFPLRTKVFLNSATKPDEIAVPRADYEAAIKKAMGSAKSMEENHNVSGNKQAANEEPSQKKDLRKEQPAVQAENKPVATDPKIRMDKEKKKENYWDEKPENKNESRAADGLKNPTESLHNPDEIQKEKKEQKIDEQIKNEDGLPIQPAKPTYNNNPSLNDEPENLLDILDLMSEPKEKSESNVSQTISGMTEKSGILKNEEKKDEEKTEVKKNIERGNIRAKAESLSDQIYGNVQKGNKKGMIERKKVFDSLSVNDIIMDIYNVRFDDTKKLTVFCAPLDEPGFHETIPVLVAVKSEDGVTAAVSASRERTSVQIEANGESFIVRGMWRLNSFKTFLYPQKLNGRKFESRCESFKAESQGIGHLIKRCGDNIYHIIPVSSTNTKDGYAQFFLCEETPSKTFSCIIVFNGKSFNAYGHNFTVKWNNDKLEAEIE